MRGKRRDAEVALGRLLGEIDDGQHAVRACTVGELCERWYSHAVPDLSPALAAEYRRLLDRRILPRWPTFRCAGFEPPTSTSGTRSSGAPVPRAASRSRRTP